MPRISLAITSIDNGYIVAKQPTAEGEVPTAVFQEDLDGIVAYLKAIWLRDTKSTEVKFSYLYYGNKRNRSSSRRCI